jgi:DDE family transposase
VGVRGVLDSTPLYDAVATMDTVTLLGAAIRGLLKAADEPLAAELRGVLASDEDDASLAKPQIDWDDQAARAALVDARARDAHAVVALLQGRRLPTAVAEAARLLAAVVGQDLEQGSDGSFRIARKVATDRMISTVDRDARHGHKTSARGFDGDKGHASVDPDSELVMATAATAGNLGDAAAAPHLLAGLVDQVEQVDGDPPASAAASVADAGPPAPTVYGDSAYGTGPLLASLAAVGIDPRVKVQAAVAPKGTAPRTSSGSTWARAR